MKSPESWERDEWITLVFFLVLAAGAYKTLHRWTQHTALPWMLHHNLLLAPGRGMLGVGRYGSLDLLRIACTILLVGAMGFVVHLAIAAPVKKALSKRDQRQDGNTRVSG